MEPTNNSNAQDTNNRPPAHHGAGNGGRGGGGGGEVATALVDKGIVGEIIGTMGMTTTTREVSSVVESQQ